MYLAETKHRRIKALFLLWVMSFVLLSAQLAGFAHRIAHFNASNKNTAGFYLSSLSVASLSTANARQLNLGKIVNGEEQNVHSCLLFEAASIADTLQHTYALLVASQTGGLTVFSDFAIFHFIERQFPFLSRAPPSLNF